MNIVSELVQEGAGAGSELVKELMQGGRDGCCIVSMDIASEVV